MSELSPRIKRFEEAGLLGCFDNTGVTSTNYKDILMSEWISVKDRLPEKDQKVLFYVLDRDQVYAGYYSIDSHRSVLSNAKFRENLDDWWFDEEIITHWMPLPNPPRKCE